MRGHGPLLHECAKGFVGAGHARENTFEKKNFCFDKAAPYILTAIHKESNSILTLALKPAAL
jgi:hypothetical protein